MSIKSVTPASMPYPLISNDFYLCNLSKNEKFQVGIAFEIFVNLYLDET